MNREDMIKEIYFVAGTLEGLTCCMNRYVPEAVADMVSDCVSRLEMVGVQLIQESEPVITSKDMHMPSPEEMTKLLKQKKVNIYAERPEEAFGRVYPTQEGATDQ